MKKGTFGRVLILVAIVMIVGLVFTACEFSEETASTGKYYINDNAANKLNKDNTTKDDAIDMVTGGIENLRSYLDSAEMGTTGYYMGVEFNIDTINPNTLKGGNFRLKIQAHLYTYPYEDEEGNPIYKYYNPKDGKYYDEPDPEETYEKVLAEDIHNELIKKSDILIEWYNGATNDMLIGMYFDGLNSNRDDPGNILYMNIQGYKRSFYDFGDTVLYRQLIRLLMSLSVEKLLTAGNIQGDAGTSSIRQLFEIAVNDNYKVVLNDPVTSILFYSIEASAIAANLTNFIQGLFRPFENKWDPLTYKYLGFKFSVVGNAIINSVASDMQFFTKPDPARGTSIMTGAHLSFSGGSLSNNSIYNYVSDATFTYDTYPPEDMVLDRDYYVPYEYGQYEFTGNLYIPLLNGNYDALIRTDMQQYDNSTNNVFMEYRDIANGELMIGGYYRYEKTFIDITGMEYMYGWIDLNELGFPKVYDESLNLAEALAGLFRGINNGIVSIVDAILSPDKNDKENHLLEAIMNKTTMTEKDPDDIFSKNTETLTVDTILIKQFLYETGQGSFTTKDIINMLDSMLPYTMEQLAIMLGAPSAEKMLDETYFKFTLNVDTNEMTVIMYTNVNRKEDEDSLMIFQLDVLPVVVGQKVNIANVSFDNFNELKQIYTYSATMEGNFHFSTAEKVDLSKLLSATIGENSGLNTPFVLDENAGAYFKLVYDQFVTDHYAYITERDEQTGEETTYRVVHKAGRSAFKLEMYITVGENTGDMIITLMSDDVAFNSDVYEKQPERVGDLGYVWVNIACVKDNNVQRIPKVKIREDIFMSSMKAYKDGTKIDDTAAELGKNEVNLSITSIIFALVEDSYVVAEPEQLEITSSNETLQSIFRVKGLIGNIRANAGFTQRIPEQELQTAKKDYGMYQVGEFKNIVGNSPYDTELHHTINVYFYDDYMVEYPPYLGTYVREDEANAWQTENFGDDIYYRLMSDDGKKVSGDYIAASAFKRDKNPDFTIYDHYIDDEGKVCPVEYIFGGWIQLNDIRVDKEDGYLQVYKYGGRVTVAREEIEINPESFWAKEKLDNRDINKVRFKLELLSFVFKVDDGYRYFDYAGKEQKIASEYVEVDYNGQIYIKYLGITDMIYVIFRGDTAPEYYYYDVDMAMTESDLVEEDPNAEPDDEEEKEEEFLYINLVIAKRFLFEYDPDSIKITEAAKTQYAPRINGSFMGTIRGYIASFTTINTEELGKIKELNAEDFYSDEDKNHKYQEFDANGLPAGDPIRQPIVLFVFEPCLPIPEEVAVNVAVGSALKYNVFPAVFDIEPEEISLKGMMKETEVTVAKGMMGEITFPVRVIITNREIFVTGGSDDEYVTVYTEATDTPTRNVPVVDEIELDPYEYIIAKNEFFINPANYNPNLYSGEGDDPEYMRVFRQKEREFVNRYFRDKEFTITFKYTESNLVRDKVKEEYIAMSYSSKDANDVYDWDFDIYEYGTYTEDKISPVAASQNEPYSVLYLHTYFKGQLIALKVKVRQMILSHILFDEDDKFNPSDYNGDKKPGDSGYIYGHYVANYFDRDSHTLPVNPTFVFTDGANTPFKKTFDMRYISGLSSTGNYIITENYALTWGDPQITYIGTNGSYYYENGVLVNRPFYISNVIRDENDTVIEEKEPIVTSNGSDVTSTSINWRYLFAVYKPIMELGVFTGEYITIPLIAGDSAATSSFLTTEIRITVECPKLAVAEATDAFGSRIVEADDYDHVGDNPVLFTPDAINTGNELALGYYMIDPLDKSSLVIPDKVKINFVNDEGKISSHTFSNLKWYSYIDDSFNVCTLNKSGNEIVREENGKYIYNMPTDKPTTTRIMAKIGSEISGYERIVLCVRVLSKDPQDVEFYYGNMPSGTRMSDIERDNLTYTSSAVGSESIMLFSYYVNTFDDFKMPTYIKAFFGVNKARSEYYRVTWTEISGNSSIKYEPNTVKYLMATIGTGEVNIYIYLAVIVENYSISKMEFADTIGSKYVQTGSVQRPEYRLVGDLLKTDFDNRTIGLSFGTGNSEKFVLISVGSSDKNVAEAGQIGLYKKEGDNFVLEESLYPKEFIERVYGTYNISFNPSEAVELPDLDNMYFNVRDEYNSVLSNIRISNAIETVYKYDVAEQQHKMDIVFKYINMFTAYYPDVVNGTISVSRGGETAGEYIYMGEYTIEELTFIALYRELSRDLDNRGVAKIFTEKETLDLTGANYNVRSMYDYMSGRIQFHNPSDATKELKFTSVLFDDGQTMTYYEMEYRLTYFNAHRRGGNPVAATRDKKLSIRNFDGIFSINDVVRPRQGLTFVESESYFIGLGTGIGSYDLRVRLVFDGGYILTSDSALIDEIELQPYSQTGYAQYGEFGYVFADEMNLSVSIIKLDDSGTESSVSYGSLNKGDILKDWYVESSTFLAIRSGTFITSVAQGIIYSQTESGNIVVSTLTKEGYRIKRRLVLPGAPQTLDNYSSINDNGLMHIAAGTITIDDIYDYIPMTEYFTSGTYLPKSLSVELNGNMVEIGNVIWNIEDSWYGATVDIGGQQIGTSALDVMTYEGTYDSATDTNRRYLMAKAEILGWMSRDGVRHDSVEIGLYIVIKSAEITSLPWDTGNLKLDTTMIGNNVQKEFFIEADAYNDATSSAMLGGTLTLPKNLPTGYRSGKKHTFYDVSYTYRGYPITELPYNLTGLDVDKFVAMFAAKGVMLDSDAVENEKHSVGIDVNVGLGQNLKLYVRFYDKTAVSAQPVIELDDESVRSAIAASMARSSSEKASALYKSVNQTRVRVNMENLYEQAAGIIERLNFPKAQDIKNNMTLQQVEAMLLQGWSEIEIYSGVPNVMYSVATANYDVRSLWNFAKTKLESYVRANTAQRARDIYTVCHSSYSDKESRKAALLERYKTEVFGGAYDYVLSEYTKLEFNRLFVKDMSDFTSAEFGYALAYKNKLEAAFDYDYIIREIYRVREYVKAGMLTSVQATAAYKEILETAASRAERIADETYGYAEGDTAAGRIRATVLAIYRYRLGWGDPVDGYHVLSTDLDGFIETFASNANIGKVRLRRELRDIISSAFDFGLSFMPPALTEIIPDVVSDNIDGMSKLADSVSAIRRSLAAGATIGTMLDSLIIAGINNYVEKIYMESCVAREIKKVQGINTETGYYYIDPYYGYSAIPDRILVEFDEETGGFAYTVAVAWSNDNVTGRVTYRGNARNDAYGYVYMWTTITEATDEEENWLYEGNTLLESIMTQVAGELSGKSWNDIKAANASIGSILLLLESDSMLRAYFTEEDIAADREACILELYSRYLSGRKLLDTPQGTVNATNLKYSYARGLYDSEKYNVLSAVLENANTKERQPVTMVAVVKDRSLSAGELRVLDQANTQVTRVEVVDPFSGRMEANGTTLYELPNRINVNGEYLEIIWNDVNITPLGDLGASTHTLLGNIHNASGQQVTIELYVDRWEYAGMAKNIGTELSPNWVEMNPLNFYFGNSLEYSAESSYMVSFNVYSLENGREVLKEFVTVPFYPEDSELLVNTTDDNGMEQVAKRRDYVIYWDRMAVNNSYAKFIAGAADTSERGDVALGNAGVGTHNLTSLSLGSRNDRLPTKGIYNYEELMVLEASFIEGNSGLYGNAVVITAADMYLPMTAQITLFENNISYDPSKLQVRVLWNLSQKQAVDRLVPFVEYAFPDVEETLRSQYALNLIMNYENRSEKANEDLLELAIAYYKDRLNPQHASMSEKEIRNAAGQLLMYKEVYNLTNNPIDLAGGAIMAYPTLLIRYGDSNYVKSETFGVRLLFGDYSPVVYYSAETHNVLTSVPVLSNAPTKLEIGVRMQYWDYGTNRSGYEAQGLISPYDNLGEAVMKLLDATFRRSDEDPSVDLLRGLRRITVTDIEYKETTVDGYAVSKSFVLDGVRYESDLIKLPVANG